MKIQNYKQFINENKVQKSALIITDSGFQDRELFEPISALKSSGVNVTVSGPKLGTIKAYNSDKTYNVEKLINNLNPQNYDILILPGGEAPKKLRKNPLILNIVRQFKKSGKPIAAICHGPLILASAGLVKGVNLTSFSDAKEEMIAAGANWVDSIRVKDKNIITSRNPGDLKQFCSEIIKCL